MADLSENRFLRPILIGVTVGTIYLAISIGLAHLGIIPTEQVQLFSNAFLVVLTGAYVIFTAEILQENIRQRRQAIQPAFALQLYARGVKISNVGNGPAIDAEISLTMSAEDGQESTETLGNQDIPVNESVSFTEGPFRDLGRNISNKNYFGNKISLSGSYMDVHHHERDITNRVYNLSEYRLKWESDEQYGLERSLDGIQDELSKIRQELDGLNRK